MKENKTILDGLIWEGGDMFYIIDGKKVSAVEHLPKILKELKKNFNKNSVDGKINGVKTSKEDKFKLISEQITKDIKK